LNEAMLRAGLRLRVLIEVDIGLRRTGVSPGPDMLRLAQRVKEMQGLTFSGLMGYEGHLLTIADPGEKSSRIHEALDLLVSSAEVLRDAGIACPIVSCGGTGSFFISVQHPGITEVQAGGGIFMDAFYRDICRVPELEYAVTIHCCVVSRPAADRAVVDAGRKTLNQELRMPLVAGRPGIRVEALSAEHGRLSLEAGEDLQIGQRLDLIPGYVDFTTVLHDHFCCFRGGRLEAIWPVEARGAIR
jgi:D-serine deaminase-like pyridoxal phosphate-dependent protein